MKRLIFAFVLIFSLVTKVAGQDIYEEISHEYIPQYFMDGAFSFPYMLEELVDEFKDLDPFNSCVMTTYFCLSRMFLGLEVGKDRVEANLASIEQCMGRDNAIYALALISKSIDENENLNVLLSAADILEETAGEDSWEYAFAMYVASRYAMDIKKYGSSRKSLEYANKCIEILEKDHTDNWLYRLASANRGIARLYAEDGGGFNELVAALDSFGEVEDFADILPFVHVAIDAATIYTSAGHHDEAIEIAEVIEQLLMSMEMGMEKSELYYAINRTAYYAYAMKKDKKNATLYYAKAESACIARFGKGSKQHKSLQEYKKMF